MKILFEKLHKIDLLRMACMVTRSTSVYKDDNLSGTRIGKYETTLEFNDLCYSDIVFSDRPESPFSIKVYDDKRNLIIDLSVEGTGHPKKAREEIKAYLKAIGYLSKHDLEKRAREFFS